MGWVDTERVVKEIKVARDLVRVDLRNRIAELDEHLGRRLDATDLVLTDLMGVAAKMYREQRRLRLGLLRVGSIGFHFQEDAMARLRFNVVLPPLPDDPAMQDEIATGRLTVTIGLGEPITIDTGKVTSELADERFVGRQGDSVVASFVWVDDADNESVTPSVKTVMLVDTIPPADPGALGISITEEIPDEVVPEPEV